MEFWFSELHSPHVKFDIRVEKQLFSGESDYQRIDVFQSPEFGKFLTLNGSVIFSEQDCFIYNEMVVHVPMSVHPDVKNVLIIGGGDGGVSKEQLGKQEAIALLRDFIKEMHAYRYDKIRLYDSFEFAS